jgi:hypothetical protein
LKQKCFKCFQVCTNVLHIQCVIWGANCVQIIISIVIIKWGFISIWVHYQGSMTFLNGLHQFYPNFENEVQKFWKLCHFLYKKPCPWNLIVMKFYASFGIGVQLSYIFLIKILCIYKLKFTFKIHEVPL